MLPGAMTSKALIIGAICLVAVSAASHCVWWKEDKSDPSAQVQCEGPCMALMYKSNLLDFAPNVSQSDFVMAEGIPQKLIHYQLCFEENTDSCPEICVISQAPDKATQPILRCCCTGFNCNHRDNIIIQGPISYETDDGEAAQMVLPAPIEHGGKAATLSPLALAALITLSGLLLVLALFVASITLRRMKLSKLQHLVFGLESGSNEGSNLAAIPPRPRLSSTAEEQDEKRALLKAVTLQQCDIIGHGKFGNVYRVSDFMGSPAAVKVFYPNDHASWEKEVRIYRLGAVQAHPCILRYITDKEDDSGCWLVTEYHPLGSIYDYLKNNTLSVHHVISLAESFFSGLAFLHEGFEGGMRVAHRDIKSRNILIKEDFSACIADFGLSMELHPDTPIGGTHSQVGTRRYMAPEVLEGAIIFTAEAFLRIDIYAASLVLWELLSCCDVNGGGGGSAVYRVPFEAELGPTPGPDDVTSFVCEKRLRPRIPDPCRNHPVLSLVCETVEECWDHDCEARLSAVCVQQRLSSLYHANLAARQSSRSLVHLDHIAHTPIIGDSFI